MPSPADAIQALWIPVPAVPPVIFNIPTITEIPSTPAPVPWFVSIPAIASPSPDPATKVRLLDPLSKIIFPELPPTAVNGAPAAKIPAFASKVAAEAPAVNTEAPPI